MYGYVRKSKSSLSVALLTYLLTFYVRERGITTLSVCTAGLWGGGPWRWGMWGAWRPGLPVRAVAPCLALGAPYFTTVRGGCSR